MEKKLLYSFTLSSSDATNTGYSRFWLFTTAKASTSSREITRARVFNNTPAWWWWWWWWWYSLCAVLEFTTVSEIKELKSRSRLPPAAAPPRLLLVLLVLIFCCCCCCWTEEASSCAPRLFFAQNCSLGYLSWPSPSHGNKGLNSRPIVNQTLDPFFPLASLPFFLPSFLPQELGIRNSHELLRFCFVFLCSLNLIHSKNAHNDARNQKKNTTPPLSYNNFCSKQTLTMYTVSPYLRGEMWRCTLGDGYFRWVSTKGHPPTRYLFESSNPPCLALPCLNQQLHWYHGKTRGVSHCGLAICIFQRQKKNYGNSNISPCKHILIFKTIL